MTSETPKTKPKSKRRVIGWDSIYREYRSGQLSNVEIAAQHGITESAIRKRAKRDGWKRDLSAKVRKGVQERLVRGAVRGSHASDEEIEDAAVERGFKVVTLHQERVATSLGIVNILQTQLEEAATIRDELEETIEKEIKGDTVEDRRKRTRLYKAVSLPTHAGVLRDLSVALKNLIGLERQAYNIDEDGRRSDDPIGSLLNEIARRSTITRLVSEDDSEDEELH